MQILVIGGGQFVGRHFLQVALSRGHQVTAFNRGLTAPQPLAGVTHLQGDRKGDLSALSARRWHAVVDTWGYLPRGVHGRYGARACRALSVRVVGLGVCGLRHANHEDSPLGSIDDVDTDVVDGRTYGPLKALCERELLQRFDSALIVRPGLVVGPHDPTQRFTYWPARIARASDDEAVLVPGAPQHPIQCIDARDLAAFMLDAIEAGRAGRFNAASPAGQWTMGELLDTCARVAQRKLRWRWADAAALASLGLQPWNDLPLWLEPQGEYAAFARTDVSAALAAGLRIRPLADTVTDTLAWFRSLPPDAQAFTKAGLSPEREAAALVAMN